MDSIKELTERIRLPFMLKSKHPTVLTDVCCICFDTQGFFLSYVRNKIDTKQLQWCEFVPWGKGDRQELLSATVKENDLDGVDCSLMLQPSNYQLLPLEALPVPPAEFQAAIRWKIKGLLPFSIKDAVIDSFSIPAPATSQSKKQIMVVAAQLSYLQPIVEQIHASGLKLQAIDIPELAYRNITALYENDEMSTALVYLQEKNSELIITRQKNFCLSRNLDWGLGVLLDIASDLDKTNDYLDSLALEIQRSFDYYQSQWRLPVPARILLSFTKITSVDILGYLSQRLTMPMQNLDLNSVITSKQKLTLEQQGQYLPVIGGALREEINNDATN